MDNAIIVDGVLAAVLVIGALVGAKRGLFKSLMGLVVVAAAMIGAVLLANHLTEPVTNFVAPKVENAIVSKFTRELDAAEADKARTAAENRAALEKLLEDNHLPANLLNGLLGSLSGTAGKMTDAAKEQATDSFRSAISTTVRATVSGVVHAVLTLVLYVVLLVVLRLVVNLVNHVFDLPVLGTINGLGGALLGLLEATALLYVAVYVGYHFGVKAFTEHAQDTHLLAFFLNHSPVELISSFTQKG